MSYYNMVNNIAYQDSTVANCGYIAFPQYPAAQNNSYLNSCFCPGIYPVSNAYYGSNLGTYNVTLPYNFNNYWLNNQNFNQNFNLSYNQNLNNNYLNNPFSNRFLGEDDFFGSKTRLTANGTSNTQRATSSRNTRQLSHDQRVELIKEYFKFAEGGYANLKGDKGGATYRGVTHGTYDFYRRNIKHLPTRPVTQMTEEEYTEIIDYFWEKSGAANIDDPILAFYVFSTDWGSGIGKSKKFLAQCGGDPAKFEQLRRDFYNRIAVGDQARFKRGWQNRVTRDHDFAYSRLA